MGFFDFFKKKKKSTVSQHSTTIYPDKEKDSVVHEIKKEISISEKKVCLPQPEIYFSKPAVVQIVIPDLKIDDFVAIDFETATGSRNSACALAMIVVKNCKVVYEYTYLIQPPSNKYSYHNTRVHGMNHLDPINKPTIEEYYQEIFNILDGANIVAHNASFDISVLNSTLSLYNLKHPTPKAIYCTYRMSGESLDSCCSTHNIELVHHDPTSDAIACAKLFGILQCLNYEVQKHEECVSIKEERRIPIFDLSTIKNNDINIDFSGKSVVITGVFEKYERSEIADAVRNLGAVVRSSISGKTDVVICGKDYGQAKIAKVMQLKEDGTRDILIVDEDYLNGVL